MSIVTGILLYLLLPGQVLARIPRWAVLLGPAGFFVASLSTLIEGEMRGVHRVYAAGLVTALMGLGRVLPLLICALTGHWAECIYLSFLLGPLVACLPAIGALRVSIGPEGVNSLSFSVPSALRFSVPVALTNLVVASLFYISRLSVLHLGLNEVAALDLALLVFGLFQLMLASSSSALLPRVASGQRLSLRRPILVTLLISLLYFLLSSATSFDLIVLNLLRLPDYDQSLRLTRTLVLAGPALLVFTLRSTELQALGAAVRVALVVTCAALLHIPLSIWMGRVQGSEGAVTSCVITLSALAIALSWLRRIVAGKLKV